MSIAPPPSEVEYPSSDGQPMAETGIHVVAIMHLHQALEDFFVDRADVFIASDMFWYWEKGNKTACIAPDVMVVPGVPSSSVRQRRSFFTWREGGAVPAVVFEMASENTWRIDHGEKRTRYQQLKVHEYFIFDPEALYQNPPLQGFRLHGSTYRRIRTSAIESVLGFRMQAEGTMLRLLDSQTGHPIPTRAEQVQRANARLDQAQAAVKTEKRKVQAEKQRADALAAEVERLKKLLGGGNP